MPMISGAIHHYPNYVFQDDGFGNLVYVDDDDLFQINFSKYQQGEF